MGEVFRRREWLRWTAPGLACLAIPVALTGCPVAAELENPGRFEAWNEPAGPEDCRQPLPDGLTVIGCDYRPILAGGSAAHCSVSSCHNAAASADLNLSPDDFLIARILNVPTKHLINCGFERCDPAACAACQSCPQGDYLLNRDNFAESWIVRKMDAFDVNNPTSGAVDMGCGNAMPYPPGNDGFTAERRQCLTDFFRWIAANGRPCAIEPTDGGTDAGDGGT